MDITINPVYDIGGDCSPPRLPPSTISAVFIIKIMESIERTKKINIELSNSIKNRIYIIHAHWQHAITKYYIYCQEIKQEYIYLHTLIKRLPEELLLWLEFVWP